MVIDTAIGVVLVLIVSAFARQYLNPRSAETRMSQKEKTPLYDFRGNLTAWR